MPLKKPVLKIFQRPVRKIPDENGEMPLLSLATSSSRSSHRNFGDHGAVRNWVCPSRLSAFTVSLAKWKQQSFHRTQLALASLVCFLKVTLDAPTPCAAFVIWNIPRLLRNGHEKRCVSISKLRCKRSSRMFRPVKFSLHFLLRHLATVFRLSEHLETY